MPESQISVLFQIRFKSPFQYLFQTGRSYTEYNIGILHADSVSHRWFSLNILAIGYGDHAAPGLLFRKRLHMADHASGSFHCSSGFLHAALKLVQRVFILTVYPAFDRSDDCYVMSIYAD